MMSGAMGFDPREENERTLGASPSFIQEQLVEETYNAIEK